MGELSLACSCLKATAFTNDRYRSVSELQSDVAKYQNGFATDAENALGLVHLFNLATRKREFMAGLAVGIAVVVLWNYVLDQIDGFTFYLAAFVVAASLILLFLLILIIHDFRVKRRAKR